MIALIIILVLLIIVIALIIGLIHYIKNRVSDFSRQYFGTPNINEAIENSEIENENTQKSLSNMENIYLDKIKKDFPDLNINEIKAMAETTIIKCFDAVRDKKTDEFKNIEKVNSWLKSKISDLKEKNIQFNSIKVHRTVINKYSNYAGISTIYLQSSFEYNIKEDNKRSKKVQSRVNTEFIYVIDESKVIKEKKVLGLNCPNCGAPIRRVGEKSCSYCGSSVKDIVKRTWVINNIIEK